MSEERMMFQKEIFCSIWLLLVTVFLFTSIPAISQDHGNGGGGGSGGGCGDAFGDLIHILRDDTTGQPILAQRWVELPASEQGYGWGYCPIGVYNDEVSGDQVEITFLPYSCDMDPVDAVHAVEVDYFGRLNGGRTKERNNRMHFDEVISNIILADVVTTEATGRLKLGFECLFDQQGDLEGCYEWQTVDSPMQSMALYTRLMKYGHLQTDPLEEDTWAHGDPNLGIQYHPALGAQEWKKFDSKLHHLLPANNANRCWDRYGSFDVDCTDQKYLDADDFLSASAYLAAAANKNGKITVDLVQYINRILKITQQTNHTVATLNWLPALYRDCWPDGTDPVDPPEQGAFMDPAYLEPEACSIVQADEFSTPGYQMYPAVQERFVDFSEVLYKRNKFKGKVDVILDMDMDDSWHLTSQQSLLSWVEFVNGPASTRSDVEGFVGSASDILRSIEYVHNFAPPKYLHCVYVPEFCQ